MISFEMEDLIGVLKGLTPYFIAIGAALIAAIAISIAVKKLPKEKKKFARGETWMAALLAVVLVVNLICLGPMSALLNLVGAAPTPTVVSEELAQRASANALKIAEEGFVLLENEDILPLTDTKKLNLFGWASTNPVYGGSGSGGINDLYEKVSLIQSITDAGFEVNQDLIDFYLGYAENRAAVSITSQNWNLPEPPVKNYSEDLIASAKEVKEEDIQAWKTEWAEILAIIEKEYPDIPDLQQDKARIDELLASGQYAYHHSAAYNAAYHPHYRIIASELIP